MESQRPPVAVIGAGPAGLAAAAALRAKGVDSVVLERSVSLAASWRTHYDRLRLHTVRWLSHLPGLAIPQEEGRWVSRDGVIRYLERYTEYHQLTVRTEVMVARVDREGCGWVLRTTQGDVPAEAVVVATGYNHTPLIPDWPGRDGFTGKLLHAKEYRNASPFRGLDVLVVGPGNTGAEVSVDLAEHGAGRVRLAVRRPPYILRKAPAGVPTQLTGMLMRRVPAAIADLVAEPFRKLTVPDLSAHGLADPGKGLYTRARRGEIPILDVGLIDAVRTGTVEPVAAVTGFDGPAVLLDDGTSIEPEVVIVATGYRRGLEPLVGHLGLVGDDGRPIVHGPHTAPSASGLHFIGFTNPVSGMFREIRIDARRIADALSGRLTTSPAPGRSTR